MFKREWGNAQERKLTMLKIENGQLLREKGEELMKERGNVPQRKLAMPKKEKGNAQE